MRVGSLFSGIGGMDLGLERAGMEIAWQCEIDLWCRKVLAKHRPDVKCYEDVHDIDERTERVDLVCGGFPCQDVSVAGRRAGLVGERSGLWFEFHRILETLRPRWVAVENVPGLLSSNGGRDFAVILRGLVELGYGVAWRILDAQYFGVPQRRRRVFIIGHLGGGRAAEVLFESEGMCGNPPSRREAGSCSPTIPASGAGTGRTGNDRTESEFCIPVAVRGTLCGRSADKGGPGGTGVTDDGSMWTLSTQEVHAVAATLKSGSGERGWNADDGAPLVISETTDCLTSAYGTKWNGNASAENGSLFVFEPGPLARGNAGSNPNDTTAPTIRADMGDNHPAVGGGFGVRRLSPRECERLQGFPDDFTAGQADGPRYRQLGNAVCVPVAEWIGRRIMQVEA